MSAVIAKRVRGVMPPDAAVDAICIDEEIAVGAAGYPARCIGHGLFAPPNGQ